MSNYNPATDSLSMPQSTRNELRPGEWFTELQTLARYPTSEIVMESGLAKEWPGYKFTWRISDDAGTPKARTAPYKTFTADNQNVLKKAELAPKQGEETFGIDRMDVDQNSGEARLTDETELGLQAMYIRCVESIEANAWDVPSVNDSLTEVGFPYYVPCPSNASGGFQGTVPSGYTTVANLDPSTVTKWRNYANLYTDFTHEDFGVKASNLFRKISFIAPAKTKDQGGIDSLRIYMGDDSLTDYELMLNTQNDQLGADGLPMFGRGMLKGITPVAVPQLNSDGTGSPATSSQPIYFINHNFMFPVFTPGWRFREESGKVPMSHQTWYGIFWAFNWVCTSRRRQGVLAKAAPFGEGAFS